VSPQRRESASPDSAAVPLALAQPHPLRYALVRGESGVAQGFRFRSGAGG
jgi:hypothetical protein